MNKLNNSAFHGKFDEQIFVFSHIKILRTFYRILIIFSLVIISDYPPPDIPSKYRLLDSGSKRKNEREWMLRIASLYKGRPPA